MGPLPLWLSHNSYGFSQGMAYSWPMLCGGEEPGGKQARVILSGSKLWEAGAGGQSAQGIEVLGPGSSPQDGAGGLPLNLCPYHAHQAGSREARAPVPGVQWPGVLGSACASGGSDRP